MSYLSMDKYKQKEYKKTRKEVLSYIKPSVQQTIKEKSFIDKIISKINKISGRHISAVVAGSFGKGTNLKNSSDFDVFVLYPPSLSREEFVKEGLSLGKKVFKGNFWEKTYAEHPYIRGIIDGYKIEIVPCYRVSSGEKIISAVDRSIFHLMFISKNMKNSQKDEVRLLKYFLKKIGCYGADSEFSGFSGYLCELLILFYNDFLELLKHVANWKPPIKFTLLKDQNSSLARFDNSIVVIDPVDHNRNVAAVVSDKQLNTFIAASRVFLQNPSINFFNKRVVNKISYNQLVGWLDNFPMVVVEFSIRDMLKEIVWSKLKKYSKKLIAHLEFYDFNILKYEVYYKDRDKNCYLFLILDTLSLPKLKSSIGPLVADMNNSQNYLDNSRGIFGPYIKGDRWYIIRQRHRTEIKPIILDYISNNLKLQTKVYVSKDVKDLYLQKIELSEFFSDFFITKEKFLI